MTKIVSKDGNPELVNKNPEIKNGMIPTMETKLYFDDPLMTFEDSSVHGCTIDLTFDELKEFCEQKTWRSLAIFQNFYQDDAFEKVGRYANSDPNYPEDWIDITREANDQFDNAGVFDRNSGACTFPSIHIVEVFYQRINTAEEPLYTVAGMKHHSTKANVWTFNNGDRKKKQRF